MSDRIAVQITGRKMKTKTWERSTHKYAFSKSEIGRDGETESERENLRKGHRKRVVKKKKYKKKGR